MNRLKLKSLQAGFSMVELMVAVTLGLIIIAGVSQVFVGSQRAYRAHEGVGRIQENGRFAIDMISRQIRMVGYRPDPLEAPDITVGAMPANSEAIFGVDNSAATGRLPGTDELVVAFVGSLDGRTVDCLGNTVNPRVQVVNRFFVGTARDLRCIVNDSANFTQNQPLLEGVSDLQILYGIDNSNCGTALNPNSGFRYVTANNVPQWCDVQSVRINITVDSIESIDPNLPNGGRLERPYSATVKVRNGL